MRTGTVFVADGGREQESLAGLAHIGIGRAWHGDEPDGNLYASRPLIAAEISRLVRNWGIGLVVSLDPHDLHQDHVDTYHAASLAVGQLRQNGYDIGHWALNDAGHGERTVPASAQSIRRKLGAMSYHRSQYPVRPLHSGPYDEPHDELHDGPPLIADFSTTDEIQIAGYAVSRQFWHSFPFRGHILEGESYDIVAGTAEIAA